MTLQYATDEELTPDRSFGTAGHALIDLGGTDTAQAIAVQPDGKIILTGEHEHGEDGAVRGGAFAAERDVGFDVREGWEGDRERGPG